MRRRIAIAIGDPDGIGPEIAVKAAMRAGGALEPVLAGDDTSVRETLALLGAAA